MNNQPIGIFDSGLGGLTVAREIARALPHESLIYLGDQARCPYGPRDSLEIQDFVHQITHFLHDQDAKLIVIACNTATSCGLDVAKQHFNVPVIGVIDAGARAAVEATQNNTLAVIGTTRTVESAAYPKAIRELTTPADPATPSITIHSNATPKLTNIVEEGFDNTIAQCTQQYGEYYTLVENYLRPLLEHEPDTLLLGCTHYPVLTEALQAVAGSEVKIICPASEVAQEVKHTLELRDQLASPGYTPHHRFYTTEKDTAKFTMLGSRIFGEPLADVRHISTDDLDRDWQWRPQKAKT